MDSYTFGMIENTRDTILDVDGGSVDDGYICSSTWMKQAYKHRPFDFKRRVLETNISCRKTLLEREYYWLQQIKNEEIGKKYYNLHNHHFNHWSTNEDQRKTVGEKISTTNKGRKGTWTGKNLSEETKAKISQSLMGNKHSEETKAKRNANRHHEYNEEFRKKMSVAANNRSEETRQKISNNSKRLHIEGRIGMYGQKHSEETRRKMSEAARLRRLNK